MCENFSEIWRKNFRKKNHGFVTSLHAIFVQNQPDIQAASTRSVLKRFQVCKRQKMQNVNDYKMAVSIFQNFEFLTPKIWKNQIFREITY